MQSRHRPAEDACDQLSLCFPFRAPSLSKRTCQAQLTVAFAWWKVLLLLVATASPGPGYDTSTRILFHRNASAARSWQSQIIEHVVTRLTRWDAIYFTSSSARGHLFEQEWAFSQPAALLTSFFARVLPSSLCASSLIAHAVAGILISHVSHLLAVLTLYQLTYALLPCSHAKRRRIAFTAAAIHILSPAGLFLSAFNGEATFALFNFLGMTSYVAAKKTAERLAWRSASYMLLSGVAFGIASMVRSNGLLSGLILAWDAIAYVPRLNVIFHQRAWRDLARLSGTVLGGLLIAAGYAQPQLVAYAEYCTSGNSRPWCENLVPSIYTWVQSHYWGVGFLRYWTLSNLPLFALATPMIVVLLGTGWSALSGPQLATAVNSVQLQDKSSEEGTPEAMSMFVQTMARFALPQLVLAALATTNFHIQIINRISSGYPVWYVLLAMAMHATHAKSGKGTFLTWLARNAQLAVRASVMYAVIQGGLYASFMPPA